MSEISMGPLEVFHIGTSFRHLTTTLGLYSQGVWLVLQLFSSPTPMIVGEGLCRIHTPNFSLPTLAILTLFPSTVYFLGHCLNSFSILGPIQVVLP